MLNLSQLKRKSKEFSLWEKIRSWKSPDIYLAENIADYQNSRRIKIPLWRRPLFEDLYSVFILLRNVGIETLEVNGVKLTDYFLIVHDDSGREIMWWNREEGLEYPLFPSKRTFKRVQNEEGLRQGDWLYDLIFIYNVKYRIPSIVDVRKYKPSKLSRKKESVSETAKQLFPQYERLLSEFSRKIAA